MEFSKLFIIPAVMLLLSVQDLAGKFDLPDLEAAMGNAFAPGGYSALSE